MSMNHFFNPNDKKFIISVLQSYIKFYIYTTFMYILCNYLSSNTQCKHCVRNVYIFLCPAKE